MARRRRETAVGFLLLAIFSTLTYQEPQKTTWGPALDIEAWNGGICSCFSAKAWTKVEVENFVLCFLIAAAYVLYI